MSSQREENWIIVDKRTMIHTGTISGTIYFTHRLVYNLGYYVSYYTKFFSPLGGASIEQGGPPIEITLEQFNRLADLLFRDPEILGQTTFEELWDEDYGTIIRTRNRRDFDTFQNMKKFVEDLVGESLQKIIQRILDSPTLMQRAALKIARDPGIPDEQIDSLPIPEELKEYVKLTRALLLCKDPENVDLKQLRDLGQILSIKMPEEENPVILCDAFVPKWKSTMT
jgi:hypothetical protein